MRQLLSAAALVVVTGASFGIAGSAHGQSASAENEITVRDCRDLKGDEAILACARLLEANRLSPWLFLRYGDLLDNRGQFGRALQLYSEAYDRYPNNEDVVHRYRFALSRAEEQQAIHQASKSTDRQSEVLQLRCKKLRQLGLTMPEECAGVATPSVASTAPTALPDAPLQDTGSISLPGTTIDASPGVDSISLAERAKRRQPDVQLPNRQEPAVAKVEPPAALDTDSIHSGINTLDGPRIALVIGNADYKSEGTLTSPINDANDVTRKLRDLGFKVTTKLNLRTNADFEKALYAHQKVLREDESSVGLVYYAGHALEFEGENYLIPTRAEINAPQDIRAKTTGLGYIQETLNYSSNALNLVVLDSCRNNPFSTTATRSIFKGLARPNRLSDGLLIIYAAKPGTRAIDSVGRNSPFTKHFLKAIDLPNLSVESMFKRLANGVIQETRGKQNPWMEGQFLGQFIFRPNSRVSSSQVQ